MLRSHLLHDSAPDESLAEKKDSDELESHNDDDYDAIASKALVRKQDLHLMPLAVWMYLLAYLDRSVRVYLHHSNLSSNLATGNARTLATPKCYTRGRGMTF